MPTRSPSRTAQTLKGWRQRAWAWVLFVALFKGLLPHAALAGVILSGDPAAVWCAPGSAGTAASAAKAADGIAASAHSCVCAAAGDGVLPQGGAAISSVLTAQQLPPDSRQVVAAALRFLPPPARGPPTL